MSFIQDFMRTQQVALEAALAAGVDSQAYEIWLDEYGGREKLQSIQELNSLFAEGSKIQEYARMLHSHMTDLLSLGGSEELLLATYDYVDRLAEKIITEIQAINLVDRRSVDQGTGDSRETENALAA